MRRWRWALVLVVAAAALSPMWAARSARADTASPEVTADAWYAPPPTCALPVGCGPAAPVPPVTRYPAHTMHIGVTAGIEDARTYLKFEPATPGGATPASGTLTIPVGPNGDGTSSPETSTAVACLSAAPFTPGEGTVAAPPAVDCAATSAVTYAAGPPATLVVDLAPFLARWRDGAPNNGIAILPGTSSAPAATWHVAFSAHDRTGSDIPPPRIELRFDAAPAATETTPSEAAAAVDEPASDAVTTDSGITDLLGAPVFAPPSSAASPIVGQSKVPDVVRSPRLVGQVGGPGFAYPVVLGSPLVLLALAGYLGWALTQPVAVTEH